MKKLCELFLFILLAASCVGISACNNGAVLPEQPSQKQEESTDVPADSISDDGNEEKPDNGKENNNGIWTGIRNPDK
mgnify:FL=1